MRKYLDALPAILILIFTVVIIKSPENYGASVGIIASAFLFGYQQYLFRTEQKDLSEEIKKIHAELYNRIEASKVESSKELTDLKTELAKFSLNMARTPGVMERPKDKPKIQF